MGEKKKKTVKDYLDALVDEKGLKSDMAITMTSKTAWTIIGVGCGVIVFAKLVQMAFPNKQLSINNQLISENNRLLQNSIKN